MKRILTIFFSSLLMVLSITLMCCAMEIDPILWDRPDPGVAQCNDDFFIEVDGKAVISATLGNKTAPSGKLFLAVIVKTLFLPDAWWADGFDARSFTVVHKGADGEWTGEIDNASKDTLIHKDFDALDDPLVPPAFKSYRLVFAIPNTLTDKNNWSIRFSPTENIIPDSDEFDEWDFDVVIGEVEEAEPVCGTEIPFTVQ